MRQTGVGVKRGKGERRRGRRESSRPFAFHRHQPARTGDSTMAFGLNRAEVIGRLGADVTVNHLASGGRVANLSIATDESYIDRNAGGERIDKTEWHRVVRPTGNRIFSAPRAAALRWPPTSRALIP